MKFFNVGENSNFVVVMNAEKQTKFGSMHYFEKIQLTIASVADYNVWQNKDGEMHLCIRYEPSLKDDLSRIIDTIRKDHGNLKFKDLDVAAMYFKVKPAVANTIPLNQKLNIAIQIYGVFHQRSNDTSYLQMEVVEVKV